MPCIGSARRGHFSTTRLRGCGQSYGHEFGGILVGCPRSRGSGAIRSSRGQTSCAPGALDQPARPRATGWKSRSLASPCSRVMRPMTSATSPTSLSERAAIPCSQQSVHHGGAFDQGDRRRPGMRAGRRPDPDRRSHRPRQGFTPPFMPTASRQGLTAPAAKTKPVQHCAAS